MDRKGYDKIDGVPVLGYDHSKHPVLAKRKSSPGASSSGNSSKSHSPKRRLHHSSASDDSEERNHSSNESHTRRKRRNLRLRQSSKSSSEERTSPTQKKDELLWDAPTQKNLNDVLKYNTSVEQTSIQGKETRLSQLSSERDRSISVDRSSTSSDERNCLAKIATEGIWPTSPERKCSVENVKKDSSLTKDSKPHSLAPKEISRHTTEKKQESNDDKRPNKFRRSRSRSRSRSPNKRQRKDYSPCRDRRRSKDRHRDRSPRRRSPYSKTLPSRSRDQRGHGRYGRNHRSRSHGRHRRSRSRSYERRRYRRDRSSSYDRHKKRHRSPSSSRSRSRGHSPRDRSKGKSGPHMSKLGSLPLSTTAGTMTPQMALQQTMAQLSAKAQALTGIELPKYYNPAAVNPLKYAEQVQKRKLLWQTKKETTTQEQSKNSIWDNLTFTQDQDGKMTQKFRKLMGIKGEGESGEIEAKEVAVPEGNSEPVALQKQEELFRNLDQQYEMARMSTHTHRGVGLGYSTQPIFPPLQKP